MYSTRYSCRILKKLEFFEHISKKKKSSNIKFYQNPFSESRVVHADVRTDFMKLMVNFRNFANATKKMCLINEHKNVSLQLCLHFNVLELVWEYWL
jgi:hypothetical protein